MIIDKIDEEYRNYKRIPIQTGRSSYAIIHMYEYQYDHIEDMMQNDELLHKMCQVDFEQSADQFVRQLEGQECRAFIEALRDRCNEYIQEDLDRIDKMRIKLGKPKDE